MIHKGSGDVAHVQAGVKLLGTHDQDEDDYTVGSGSLEPMGCLKWLLGEGGNTVAVADPAPSGTRPSQCLA